MENPFLIGDRVVCINDQWHCVCGYEYAKPRKGQCLNVAEVVDEWLGFDEFYGTRGERAGFLYTHFAPVQDATEMESDESEVVQYEEMTV